MFARRNPGATETRAYYDEFASGYEAQRGPNDPGGYHALIDDLEVDFASRYAAGAELLEVGCGTGLLLERFAQIARRARGIDLSPGMLARARERGLDVRQGSALDLPYPDASFDVTCSFKVLAHVEPIERALREMLRVTREDGVVIAEFYNPISLRGLAKALGPPGPISPGLTEREVYTRFDPPWSVSRLLPPGCEIVARRGIRILTPAASALRVPLVGSLLRAGERALADSRLSVFGGFWVAAVRRRSSRAGLR